MQNNEKPARKRFDAVIAQRSHILWGALPRIAGRSFDSDIIAFSEAFPGKNPVAYIKSLGKTPSSRQQDCSGFSPDSLNRRTLISIKLY